MDSENYFDIRKEPLISKEWNFNQNSNKILNSDILITGANSFLGAHVVKNLQQEWKGNIHLLVRGKSREEAQNRMEAAFLNWNLGKFEISSKIKFYNGDVCDRQMGLPVSDFECLANEVGYVLHLAMNPLYYLPYSRFQKTWLPELEQMILFCGNTGASKSLHYPSSYNAGFFTENEDFKCLNQNAWQSGYAGFKWVANQVLNNAMKQGLRACIYDIPLVVGSASLGRCPENYSIWFILDMFLESGFFIPYEFPIIPINLLAEIITQNLLDDVQEKQLAFVRPVLKTTISHKDFEYYATEWFRLKLVDRETMCKAVKSKRKFNFVIPENFNELLAKVNSLEPVLPDAINSKVLPEAFAVFLCNLNHKISEPKYREYLNKYCARLN